MYEQEHVNHAKNAAVRIQVLTSTPNTKARGTGRK
jgi:hypothetical protein